MGQIFYLFFFQACVWNRLVNVLRCVKAENRLGSSGTPGSRWDEFMGREQAVHSTSHTDISDPAKMTMSCVFKGLGDHLVSLRCLYYSTNFIFHPVPKLPC